MTYLLDTDHISVLQRQSGAEVATIMAQIAQQAPTELAFSIISVHARVSGRHTSISHACTASEAVRGYRMLAHILWDFAVSLGCHLMQLQLQYLTVWWPSGCG